MKPNYRTCGGWLNFWLISVAGVMTGLIPASAAVTNFFVDVAAYNITTGEYPGSIGYFNVIQPALNPSNDFFCATLCDCPPGKLGSGSPCADKGMPIWSVSEPYLNLWVSDTSLGYEPAKGPPVAFQISYKSREAGAGYSTDEFSVGRGWNCAWYSFVVPSWDGSFQVQWPGGGTLRFPSVNTNEFLTHTRLEDLGGGQYRLRFPDGRANIYGMEATVNSQSRIYLTEIQDRSGQKLRLEYANQGANPGVVRLLRVIDADGRTNQIEYAASGYSTNLIVSVRDAFGRTNAMRYDAQGRLTNIVDVAGLSSSFNYETNDWMTALITPYGTNTFAGEEEGDDGNAWLRVVDAGGGRHLWVYETYRTNALFTGVAADPSPLGYEIEYRKPEMFNSYYWGPRQVPNLTHTNDLAALTGSELRLARRKHWLMWQGQPTLSMERAFSPDGVNDGQEVWYDYRAGYYSEAIQNEPLMIAHTLPNGETRLEHTDRNDWGAVTNFIGTWSVAGGAPLLRTNQFVYSADGLDLLESYDAAGHRASATGYVNHLPVAVTNVLGEVTRSTYHASGQPTSVSHYTGLATTNLYFTSGDYTGWLQSSIDYAGSTPVRTNSFSYTNGVVYTHTDERGSVTTNTWDALNRLTSRSDGLGTVSNIYSNLDLVRTVDRMGFTNGFVYDAMRRLTDRYDAMGRKTHYEYCTCGALESVTDALTNTTSFTYDAGGRQIGMTGPDNYWVTNGLNLLGQIVATVDRAGASSTNYYNNQGLICAVSNAWGRVGSVEFDVHDRVTSQTDANGVTVTNAYDAAGRLLASGTPANGALQRFGYTANISGPTSYTNALTNVTQFHYDAYGRKTNEISGSVTTPLATNSFGYAPDGLMTTLKDGNGHLTAWNYDRYGRLTNKVDHLGTNTFIYGYDSNSRMTSRTTPAKGTTAYGYDAVGNLTSVNYPVSADLALQYDALNRLTNMVDGVGTTAFSYDKTSQLLAEDGPWANDTVSYTHTNRLRTALSVQQPSGSWAMTYAWDNARRLTNVISPAGGFSYSYGADMPSRMSAIALPGGAYITNAFDALSRLTNTTYVNPGGAVLNSHGYALNVGDQRTQQQRMGPAYTNTVDYGYDPLGQVTSALGKEVDGSTRLHEKFGYKYDPAGNLTTRTNNALIQTFTVDALNQLTNVARSGTLTVSGNTSSLATNVTVNGQIASRYADLLFAKDGFTLTNGTNTFTAIAQNTNGIANTNAVDSYLPASNPLVFDANGNLTFDGQKAFEYDDENQLVRTTQTNVFKTEFTYDGKMRLRVKKEFSWSSGSGTWVLGGETRHIYGGMLVIQERDASNTPLVSYTRGRDLGDSLQGAGGIGGLLARTDHTQTSALLKTAFYHADGNGNITALLSTNGLVVAWYQYSPFGTTLAQSGSLASANVYRFSSKQYVASAGLYYYGYRFYIPELQRWLNRDPIQEWGGFNLFGMLQNDALNYVDRVGLDEVNVVTANTSTGDGLLWSLCGSGKVYKGVDSNEELISSLEKHAKESKEKIDMLNLSGHGFGCGVSYGKRSGFHANTLTDDQVRRLKNLLAENAEIKLWGCYGANDPKGQQALANKLGTRVTAKTDLVSAGPDVDFVCDGLEEMFTELLAETAPPPDWITVVPNSPGTESPVGPTPPQPKDKKNKGK